MISLHHRESIGLEAALTAVALSVAWLVGRSGTPSWQVCRVVLEVIFVAVLFVCWSRLGSRWRGGFALVVGVLAFAVGLGHLPYLMNGVDLPVAIAGVVLDVSGLVLVIRGIALATRGTRWLRRLFVGGGTVVALVLVAFVVGPAVAATNVPRPSIGASPATVGLAYESARLTTPDGVELAAWYVPSTNRAALVLLHGAGSTRSDVLEHAAVLAGHGYGVLLIDARGHGESAGRAMDFGWHGDDDIAAATTFLSHRNDVDPTRIGLVGLSMGGEEALGASARDSLIRAVVAEGATARSAADEEWLSDEFGLRGLFQEQLERVQDWITDLLTSASTPTGSRVAVATAAGTRYLLITAGNVSDERRAAVYVASAAPDRVEVWTVAGAGHTGGLRTAPVEWERRVTTFLDAALEPAH